VTRLPHTGSFFIYPTSKISNTITEVVTQMPLAYTYTYLTMPAAVPARGVRSLVMFRGYCIRGYIEHIHYRRYAVLEQMHTLHSLVKGENNAPNPGPCTPNPQPRTLNLELPTHNPKLRTPNPEPRFGETWPNGMRMCSIRGGGVASRPGRKSRKAPATRPPLRLSATLRRSTPFRSTQLPRRVLVDIERLSVRIDPGITICPHAFTYRRVYGVST